MCRLLGIVPRDGAAVDPWLLESFRGLASTGRVKRGASPGHSDGWGVVTWISSAPQYLGREPRDAYTDPMYDEMLSTVARNPVRSHLIGHLRKASRGSKIAENTHPFTSGAWAFAHNGTIRKLNLHDRTDSEWFFLSLMGESPENTNDMIDAIRKRVAAVRSLYNYSSITFLLSNGNEMFAYRDYAGHEDYYTLYYTRTDDAFIVSQEKILDADWHEVENKHLLHVYDGTQKIHNFSSVA